MDVEAGRTGPAGRAPTGRAIDLLSLRCALALVFALGAFALLIVIAKPALSTLLFGDVSVYLVLIVGLALSIWVLTWFYMARLPIDADHTGPR